MKKKLIAIIAISLLAGVSCQQKPKSSSMRFQETMAAAHALYLTAEYYSKGGVGIIVEGLYVSTRSTENVIMFSQDNAEWKGTRKENQIVYVYKGAVIDGALPDDFDINKSIMICFTKDRITFMDFSNFDGGFYRRWLD